MAMAARPWSFSFTLQTWTRSWSVPSPGAHRSLIPAQNQFWGDRTARIVDPSGHVWIVASRIEETTEEQRAKRWSDVRDAQQ